jgi:monoamine oxidase
MEDRRELDTQGRPAAVADDLDVAVVGGGVSGAYVAWRLQTAAIDELGASLGDLARARAARRLRVGLFEYGDRIGGRLFSLTLPGVPDTPVELGGMRFLNSHTRVLALVRHFSLEYRELAVEDPGGRHLFYLRGRHFTGADWGQPAFEPPYRLERGERTRSPGSLLVETAIRHREDVERFPERYRDVGFWNLLLQECSDQAYQLIRDAGGYHTLVSNWSAAEAIPFLLADFAIDSKYFALQKGFETLPRELHREFEAAGGTTRFRHRLHRLDRDGGGIRLTFDTGDPAKFRTGRRLQEEVSCRARHVVLAMPRRAIELLHPDSFIFDSAQFEEDVRSVLPQPGFKIFTAYRRPWWKATKGVTAGRSVTDLPIRQCYYWVTGSDQAPNSVLMASYSDGMSVEYWAGLARRGPRYEPPPPAWPPAVALPGPADDLRGTVASAPLVDELQRQLRELHGLSDVKDPAGAQILPPYVAVFKDWAQEPFGGGWHFWKIGVNVPLVMRRMERPLSDAPLYICGEAWSRQQGWVEGALQTADAVLERQLSVSPPAWMRDVAAADAPGGPPARFALTPAPAAKRSSQSPSGYHAAGGRWQYRSV